MASEQSSHNQLSPRQSDLDETLRLSNHCSKQSVWAATHNALQLWSAVQVKPFILRRTKDKVLSDLPPKILQDVYIDPSPLQRLLYQDFAGSDASHQVEGAIQSEGPTDAVADKAPHVFQVRFGTVPRRTSAVPTMHACLYVMCCSNICPSPAMQMLANIVPADRDNR